jgi:hypothetical protein
MADELPLGREVPEDELNAATDLPLGREVPDSEVNPSRGFFKDPNLKLTEGEDAFHKFGRALSGGGVTSFFKPNTLEDPKELSQAMGQILSSGDIDLASDVEGGPLTALTSMMKVPERLAADGVRYRNLLRSGENITPEVIATFNDYEGVKKLNDFVESTKKTAPRFYAWMSDPYQAAASRDSAKVLAGMNALVAGDHAGRVQSLSSGIVSGGKQAAKTTLTAVKDVTLAASGAASYLTGKHKAPRVAPVIDAMLASDALKTDEVKPRFDEWSLNSILFDVGQVVPQVASSFGAFKAASGAGKLAGLAKAEAQALGQTAGGFAMGAQIYGGTLDDRLAAGDDLNTARAWSLANALLQGKLETAQIGIAMKLFSRAGGSHIASPLWGTAKAGALAMGKESGIEALQSAAVEVPIQIMSDAFREGKTLSEAIGIYYDRLPETLKQAGYEGLLVLPLGFGGVAHTMATTHRQYQIAKFDHDMAQRLVAAAEGTPLAKSSPEVMERYVEQILKDNEGTAPDSVFLRGNDLGVLYSENLGKLAEDLAPMGVTKAQLDHAIEHGTDIVIPMAKWAAIQMDPATRGAIAPYTRFRVDGLTQLETAQKDRERGDLLARTLKEKEPEYQKLIQDNKLPRKLQVMREQLIQAHGVHYADVYVAEALAFADTMGQRMPVPMNREDFIDYHIPGGVQIDVGGKMIDVPMSDYELAARGDQTQTAEFQRWSEGAKVVSSEQASPPSMSGTGTGVEDAKSLLEDAEAWLEALSDDLAAAKNRLGGDSEAYAKVAKDVWAEMAEVRADIAKRRAAYEKVAASLPVRHEFKTGAPVVVSGFHGSANDFTEFSKEALGKTTKARSARIAFFGVSDPAVASEYSSYASTAKGAEEVAKLQDEMRSLELKVRDTLMLQNGMLSPFSQSMVNEETAKSAEYKALFNYTKRNLDDLGFGGTAQAVGAILTVKDWASRWEMSSEEETEVKRMVAAITAKRQEFFEARRARDLAATPLDQVDALSKQAVETRAKLNEAMARQGTGGNVMPLFYKFKNPLVVNHDYEERRFTAALEKAKAEGHDGVIFTNSNDDPSGNGRKATVLAVFEPTQIKSSIANNGAFDPNNPNILEQKLAARIASALKNLTGPAAGSEISLPPADTGILYSIDAIPEWERKTAEWMRAEEYTEEEIAKRLASMRGQMAIYSALGPIQVQMFPKGAGMNPAPKRGPNKGKGGPIRGNNDLIYKVTFDLSAMCVKRLAASATMAQVQRQLNRALTASERMALVNLFKLAGKQAPCIYCYVESPRSKAGEAAKNGLDVITGNAKPKSSWSAKTKAAAARARAEYLEQRRSPSEVDSNVVLDPQVAVSQEGQARRAAAPAIYDFLEAMVLSSKQNTPKLYEEYSGQILELAPELLAELNGYAGFRFFSSSDFQIEHTTDLMQAVMDLEIREAKAHAYTKTTEFAEIFGATGMKINTSLFAEVDKKTGEIVMDTYQGMDWEKAKALRAKFPNVGTVIVASDDRIVQWALQQDWIDYIIPFHYSGLEGKFYEELAWQDFTSTQTEIALQKGLKANKVRMHELGVAEGVTNEEATRRYLEMAMERKLLPVFPAFLFNDYAPTERTGDVEKDKNLRRKQNKQARERWAAMVEAGAIDWAQINPNYFKLKKDFARTDTPFEAVQSKFDGAKADEVLQKFLKGDAPRAENDPEIAAELIRRIEEAKVTGVNVGVEALREAKNQRELKSPYETKIVDKTVQTTVDPLASASEIASQPWVDAQVPVAYDGVAGTMQAGEMAQGLAQKQTVLESLLECIRS